MTKSTHITPFDFFFPTQVQFGEGKSQELGHLCQSQGYGSAFVVIDPGVYKSGAVEGVLANLRDLDVKVVEWTDLQSNPIDTDVEAAAAKLAENPSDVIIGIGGGSAQDTAKGIAVLAANGGRVRDYAGNGNVPRRARPFILVPTTAGTGSEATANASITQSDSHDKLAIRDPNAYAYHAILDPNLLAGLPAGAAAAAGIDALTHAIESYTSTRASEMSRFIAYESISRIATSLENFVADRADKTAAGNMLYASFLAGIAISHTGTGAAHALSRAVGGRFGVAHGIGCGVALAPVMQFNAAESANHYATIARALGVYDENATPESNAALAAARVDEIRQNIGIPLTLGLSASAGDMDDLGRWVVENAGPNPRTTGLQEARQLLEQIL